MIALILPPYTNALIHRQKNKGVVLCAHLECQSSRFEIQPGAAAGASLRSLSKKQKSITILRSKQEMMNCSESVR